jgi:hypothetical protein
VTGTPAVGAARAAALWPLLPGAIVVVAVAGALIAPLLTGAVVLAAVAVAVSVRWPRATALSAMIAGPMFLSGFPAGPVTLDNVAVLYGTAVGVAWLLTHRRHATPLAAWPVALALAAFVAAVANGGAGIEGAVRFLSLAVLVLVLAASDAQLRRRAMAWVEIAVTAGALVLVAQPLTGYPDAFGTAEGVGQRFGGLFGHPNFAAYTVCLVLLYQVYARAFTAARTASVAVLLLALVLTGSRAALLVFALLLLPALWLRARRFFALLVPAVVALPFVGTTILTRLQSITATGGLSGQNASGWRFGQWEDALQATRGNEWFGIGWGRTTAVLSDSLGAHSTYVQLWLELGRVGTAVAAIGLVLLIRSTRGRRTAQVLLGYAVVTGISDPVLLYPSCLTALLVALSVLLDDDRPSTPAGEPAGPAAVPRSTTIRPIEKALR